MKIRPKIAILVGRSLFTDGIISRLERSYSQVSFKTISLFSPNLFAEIVAFSPDIMLMDQQNPEFMSRLQSKLSPVMPRLKVVIVGREVSRAQVIQWNEYPASNVGDLLKVIGSLFEGDQNFVSETPR